VALNESEEVAAALSGVAEISPIIARYAKVEDIYIKDSSAKLD
jgi:hypothetical protein